MRLTTTIRLLLERKSIKIVSIALIFILFCLNPHAQTYKLTCNNENLSETLIKVSRQYKFKVAFDALKLSTFIVHNNVEGNTIDEFLHNLISDYDLDYEYKHGTYLIVSKDALSGNTVSQEYQIIGSITDKETGEQLAQASVSLPSQNYSMAASANGSFFIKNKTADPVNIDISYIGYNQIDTVININRPSQYCEFKLSRKLQTIDTVIVKTPKIDMVEFRNDVDFAITINPSKLNDLPMFGETDIFKSLQLLPGISYSESSSELSIRGGSSDQNLVLYDGQTLYSLSHYYGMFSSLNPNIIKDIQVYKGGYDSRYGERVSGIIDITGKSGNQLNPTVYGDLNLVSGNIAAEIPLSKRLTVVLAARRSFADIYSTEFANNLLDKITNPVQLNPNSIITMTTPNFYFYDLNSKLTYRVSNKESLSLSVYGGNDYYNNYYDVKTNSLLGNVKDYNTWSNYGISAEWLKQWSIPLFTNVQIGTSGYTNDYNSAIMLEDSTHLRPNQKYLPNTQNFFNSTNQNKLTDFSLSLRNTWYLDNTNQINFGLLARRNTVYYHKDADEVYVYDNYHQESWIYSTYLQDRIQVTDRLTIKPGFRLSLYNGTNQLYFEPRFAANYKFSDQFSARFATGHFCQFISQVVAQQDQGYTKNFWVLADDSLHPVEKSNHFIIGSTYEKGNLLVDVEAYYKTFSGLQEYLYISQFLKNSDFPNYFPAKSNNETQKPTVIPNPNDPSKTQPSYYIDGTGKSYGIDLSIRYKHQSYTSWISYSLSKSVHQFPFLNNNQEFPAPTDQTHQLSWSNMVTYKNWNFGSTTLFSTGRPYIDFSNDTQAIPTIRVYKRLPNYFRTDLSANYNFIFMRTKIKFGGTIINIFDTNNYFDINNRKFDFDNTSFSETNIIRAQKLSFNLFLHFVI